jgi:hypothetical protein
VDPLTPEQARRLARALLAEDDEEPARYGGGAMPLRPAPSARPRLRIFLLRVLVFAAIGAAATVLVAWGSHLRRGRVIFEDFDLGAPVLFQYPLGFEFVMPYEGWAWPCRVPAHWPEAGQTEFAARRSGVLSEQWRFATWGREFRLTYWESGWPERALAGAVGAEIEQTTPVSVRPFHGFVLQMSDAAFEGGDPLWPGFALDTAFYGGMAFLVWSAPGSCGGRCGC